MNDLLPVAIGLGLAINLLFSELFGLAAGGMVVPGYVALNLHRPMDVLLTLGAGVVTFFLVHLASLVTIVYGKRRTVLMILVGFLLGSLVRQAPAPVLENLTSVGAHGQVIGFIIPGLIGIWIDRQGIVETLSVLLTAAVVVRLLLILFVGMETT